jgi:hypothetical protein
VAVTIDQRPVGTLRKACRRNRDGASAALLVQPGSGDMVRMDMGVQRTAQLQAQFSDQGSIAPDLLEYRIDQYRFVTLLVGQQVTVCR